MCLPQDRLVVLRTLKSRHIRRFMKALLRFFLLESKCRKCSIVRLDRQGHLYIGTCKSREMASAQGDNLHVSDMPSPAPERELAPSGPIHSDRSPEKSSSEIPTAEPTQLDTSADNLQHASHLEGHKPQSTFHDWLQHGKAMFQRLIGWEQSSQTDMKSHSMATNKVLVCKTSHSRHFLGTTSPKIGRKQGPHTVRSF